MVKAYFQIVGTSTGDTSPCVYLFIDNQRYLFNFGEGMQRFCMEHKVRFPKVSDIFLTRISAETCGGLPGAMLTLFETGKRLMNLHGPLNLLKYVYSLRFFVNRPQFVVNVGEYSSKSAEWTDQGVTFTPIAVSLPSTSSSTDTQGDSPAHKKQHRAIPPGPRRMPFACNIPSFGAIPPQPWTYETDLAESMEAEQRAQALEKQELSAESADVSAHEQIKTGYRMTDYHNDCEHEHDGDDHTESVEPEVGTHAWMADHCGALDVHPTTVVCYIAQLVPVPGKFDVKKAKELGVPAGPLCGKLTKGESVVTPAGKTVHPSDCVGASTPGPLLAIVDCPSLAFLPHLVAHPQWATIQHLLQQPAATGCFVHMAPADVIADPAYIQFVNSFGSTKSITHYVVNAQHCPWQTAFCKSAGSVSKRSLLDSLTFPIPYSSETPAFALPVGYNRDQVKPGEILLQHHLVPIVNAGMDRSQVIKPVLLTDAMKEVATVQGLQDLIDSYKLMQTQPVAGTPSSLTLHERGHTKIVFLGTGSAIPSQFRNVSGIYFRMGDRSMFMDCGEGTMGQMLRAFGAEQLDMEIRNCSVVWVSHLHADHHLGLVSILRRRKELGCGPTLVIGPKGLDFWLDEYAQFENVEFDYINAESLCRGQKMSSSSRQLLSVMMKTYGFTSVVAVPVVHCYHAYAIVLEHAEGWKLVYSGDLRPSPELELEGKGATVVIHEATFEAGLEEDALAKNHSTTQEAIESCLKMDAYRILLTHFSQRYPKLPVLGEHADCGKVLIAFDFMQVDFLDLPLLPATLPALISMYASEDKEEDLNEEENQPSTA